MLSHRRQEKAREAAWPKVTDKSFVSSVPSHRTRCRTERHWSANSQVSAMHGNQTFLRLSRDKQVIQVLIWLRLTAEGRLFLKTVDEVGIRLKAPIHHARKSCTLNPVTKVQKKITLECSPWLAGEFSGFETLNNALRCEGNKLLTHRRFCRS